MEKMIDLLDVVMMNKETIKQFLRPNWRKIIVGIILTLISIFFVQRNISPLFITDVFIMEYGFPLAWLIKSGGFVGYSFHINYLKLTVDLIFWYFPSCLVVFLWDKVKDKIKPLFKAEKKRVIITGMLFVGAVLFLDMQILGGTSPLYQIYEVFLFPVAVIVSFLFERIESIFMSIPKQIQLPIALVMVLSYFYLISCLIIFAYDKFKSKK